jgi:predicted TIM-barrel fold metal-dependent hydrolase
MTVDADTHVLETEKTFAYLANDEQGFKPAVVSIAGNTNTNIPLGQYGGDLWLIDGQLYGKHDLSLIERHGNGEIVPGTLDLSNPEARLAAMDRQGVDTAVIYPSLFLVTAIGNADAEMALARSYNRWLAELCATAPQRLKFAMIVCPRRIEPSVKEMEWAKQHGACGVLLRGFEGDQTPDQPELHRLFAKACDLDMPICIHIGHGSNSFRALKVGSGQRHNPFLNRVPTMIAFSALLDGDLNQRFPSLRFAIVEAGSSWLPSVSVMALRARNDPDKANVVRQALVDHQIYITCEDHEDLPAILPFAGDDNLVIGSDFGHPGDVSESIHVQENFRGRDDISEDVKSRIMGANARALYAL